MLFCKKYYYYLLLLSFSINHLMYFKYLKHYVCHFVNTNNYFLVFYIMPSKFECKVLLINIISPPLLLSLSSSPFHHLLFGNWSFAHKSTTEISSSNCKMTVFQESQLSHHQPDSSPTSLFVIRMINWLSMCLPHSFLPSYILSSPIPACYYLSQSPHSVSPFHTLASSVSKSNRIRFLIHYPNVHMIFRSCSFKYHIKLS